MPDIDDIFKKYEKQIKDEMKEHSHVLQTTVQRGTARRPWSDAEGEAPEATAAMTLSPPVWYGAWAGIWSKIKQSRIFLFTSFFGSLMILVALAQFVPSIYHSTLQLYAPEKTDSISSRLALFSNRVEFASFPVDFKIPLGLIARRLKGEAAKNWVLQHYATLHSAEGQNAPSLVSAETFYAEGSELLVLQGYANDAQVAAEVTNLYWDYFENEIRTMKQDHLRRINQWIDLTSNNIQQSLSGVTTELTQSTVGKDHGTQIQLNSKLGSNYADVELKRIRAQKQLEELNVAAATGNAGNMAPIWTVSHPDIQDLREVERALEKMGPSDEVNARRTNVRARAIQLVHKLLTEQTLAYSALTDEARRIKSQLGLHPSEQLSGQQDDLLRQQAEYRAQLVELQRLRAQINVESNITPPRLRVIQPAVSDPTSRQPSVLLKYFICCLASILLTVLLFVGAQLKAARLFSTGRIDLGTSVRSPQPAGAGS